MIPPNPLAAEAQLVLDELWAEKLIPFELNVGALTTEADGHTIHFHDSRINTARVPSIPGESFKDAVRSAVIARVRRMSGPLGDKAR
jgi:hypothetical protein